MGPELYWHPDGDLLGITNPGDPLLIWNTVSRRKVFDIAYTSCKFKGLWDCSGKLFTVAYDVRNSVICCHPTNPFIVIFGAKNSHLVYLTRPWARGENETVDNVGRASHKMGEISSVCWNPTGDMLCLCRRDWSEMYVDYDPDTRVTNR